MGVIPSEQLLVGAGTPTSPPNPPRPSMTTPLSMAESLASQASGTIAGAGLINLLLRQPEEGSSDRPPKVWVGEGLPTVPKRVYERMVRGEYVDLAELCPAGALDSLNPEPDPQHYVLTRDLQLSRARRRPIKDINTWIQCFTVYVAVRAKKSPEVVPEMLVYLLTIMRAQKEFEEPAWRLYDVAFREKAASTRNTQWSKIDPHLYNQVFTGRARRVTFCTHCQATTHTSEECKEAPPRKKVAVSGETGWGPSGSPSVEADTGICWQFNQGFCEYQPNCRFKHVCSACRRKHPFVTCTRVPRAAGRGGYPPKRPPAGRGALYRGQAM